MPPSHASPGEPTCDAVGIHRRRLYRFFPTFSALLIFGLAYRLKAKNHYSVLEHMLIARYWEYGWRKLLGALYRAKAGRRRA